jgi:peptide/nickel transport system ATP-binding protein
MHPLEIEGLRVEVTGAGHDIVDEVSLEIAAGEILGVVGESGSGKTTLGLAVLAHARRGARIAAGEVRVAGDDILRRRASAQRSLRGRVVSYVPQDPSTSLNPALRLEHQLMEMLELHGFGADRAERAARLAEMLEEVRLPSSRAFLRRYPHQLSGGQQQRVAIAMAFACRPQVIVLDEPTTGLDVTTQAHVLATVRKLCSSYGAAAVYISHDLAVVAELAQRVAVMYAGRIVEVGPTEALFRNPAHPYTRRLIQAIPSLSDRRDLVGIKGHAPMPGRRPGGCAFAPRCELAVAVCHEQFPPVAVLDGDRAVRCHRHADVVGSALGASSRRAADRVAHTDGALLEVVDVRAAHGDNEVLHGIDIAVAAHECLALVGESGSGKTTLARCISGLHTQYTGEVRLEGRVLPAGSRNRSREVRREIQYIFQNPYGSLNPRKTIGQSIEQPLRLFFDLSQREMRSRVGEALERVSLPAGVAARQPDQLSGGERQRVAIARALVSDPVMLVCDEVTSALDVSVQAVIVELLRSLKDEMGLALLFVTHNLALIRSIAERVAVLQNGQIVEMGTSAEVLDSPAQPYTQALLRDTPSREVGAAPADRDEEQGIGRGAG